MVNRPDVTVANSIRLVFDNDSQYVSVMLVQFLEGILEHLVMNNKSLASIRQCRYNSPCTTARVPSHYRF